MQSELAIAISGTPLLCGKFESASERWFTPDAEATVFQIEYRLRKTQIRHLEILDVRTQDYTLQDKVAR